MTQRLLVVDDDPQIVCLLRANLEQAGDRVFVAYNGKVQQSYAKGEQL
jgi:DNA-binding response OmpR family regulator